jgi:hypothetical protein
MKGTEDVVIASKPDETSATMQFIDAPRVVVHKIPRIDLYQVTEDELARLQEGQGQDQTFASASLGVCVTALATLFSSLAPSAFLFLLAIGLIAGVVCLYTGLKWRRARKNVLQTVARIRNRN